MLMTVTSVTRELLNALPAILNRVQEKRRNLMLLLAKSSSSHPVYIAFFKTVQSVGTF